MSINSIALFLTSDFKRYASHFCIQLALKNKLSGDLRDLLTNTDLIDRSIGAQCESDLWGDFEVLIGIVQEPCNIKIMGSRDGENTQKDTRNQIFFFKATKKK